MKKILFYLIGAVLLVFSGCAGSGNGYRIVDNTIVFDVPERAEGQKSVLGLRTEPLDTVRVGFIGLGMRGPGAVKRFTYLDGVEIKALCDLLPDRVAKARKILADRGWPEAAEYSGEDGWKALCERNDIDLSGHSFVSEETKKMLMEKYRHPITAEIEARAREVGGHGGMDFIMDYRLVYCLRNGLPLDQDVYDAAEWSCIGDLSAASIENGNMPVEFPDFTRGDWNRIDGYRHAVSPVR